MARKIIVIEDSDTYEDGEPYDFEHYFCPYCDRRIIWRTERCKNCKNELDWSEIR